MALPHENGFPHQGHVDFAATTLTPSTGTLLMRGIFPNPHGKILPGLYARIHVPIKEKNAFLVPQESIGSDQRGSYVLVVNQGNIVQRTAVKIGTAVDDLRAVEEGLSGEEWIVIKGLQKAVPGRAVKPEKQDLKTSAPGSPGPAHPQKEGS
jgi:RND family efflux transporter MFP subunit